MRPIVITFALFLSLIAFSTNATNRIFISKQEMTLTVYNENDSILLKTPISCGMNYGNKTRKGDNKTPEGTFAISMIQDSSSWTFDFNDGHGKRKGAYGPYFLRLKVPRFTSIGIHGTCFPELIGTRSSHGCVRIANDILIELVKLVNVGTKVTITPDQ